MIIHIITKRIINKYGIDILRDKRLVNILNDMSAFTYEIPSIRTTMLLILDSYGNKILSSYSKGMPGEITISQYKHEFSETYGIKEEISNYVFDTLAYGISWIKSIKENVINNAVFDNPTDKMNCYALLYYYLGMPITQIKGNPNDGHFGHYDWYDIRPADSYKNPISKEGSHLSMPEIKAIDWNGVTGLGMFTSDSKIKVIDFDNVRSFDIVEDVLKILGLPQDYSWVVKSGSGSGFHVYIRLEDDIKEDFKDSSFSPTGRFEEEFSVVEFLTQKHVVLPGSTGRPYESNDGWDILITPQYKILGTKSNIPLCEPQIVDIDRINNLFDYFCGMNTQDHIWLGAGKDSFYMFRRAKQDSAYNSSGFHNSCDDDMQWVQYCTSEIGRIAYAVKLVHRKEYAKALSIFKEYVSDYAKYNIACLYAHKLVEGNKQLAEKYYRMILNSDSIHDYEKSQLKKTIDKM